METAPDRLSELRRHLDKAIDFNDLARCDWRRQTDAVQDAFIVAALFVDLGRRVVFVDGHINDYLKRDAINAGCSVKTFFNRRFHDFGLTSRRVVYFDTVATRKMGKRGSGCDKLHFHAVLERPPGWSKAKLVRRLAKVFGYAEAMGARQFHVTEPRWDQHYTHNGVQVSGPLGKLMYSNAHAGSTYNSLKLNEDSRRSRRAPASRATCNRKAQGLAKGIPSNFCGQIVFSDHASKRAGKEAFDLWVKDEKAKRLPVQYGRVPDAPSLPNDRAEDRRA